MKKRTGMQCGVCNRPEGRPVTLPSGLPFVLCTPCEADRWQVAAAERKAKP